MLCPPAIFIQTRTSKDPKSSQVSAPVCTFPPDQTDRDVTDQAVSDRIFDYPSSPAWEFTSSHPIRSALPLWLVYGIPMYILRWLWQGFRHDEPPPWLIFYMLRGVMFTLSFVLEDWALHELVPVTRQRRVAMFLIASSYVTWTWQTHTFSNSIETVVVLWCLVLVDRITGESQRSPQKRSRLAPPAILAFLLVFGVFNRITFPAFVFVPLLQLIPHFQRKYVEWVLFHDCRYTNARIRPLSFLFMMFVGALTTLSAITIDTNFYQPMSFDLYTLTQKPTITPLNNIMYNTDTSNLAQHGIHPLYQHAFANLPQLLGPVFPLLLLSPRLGTRLYSAIAGCVLLSLFPHQEARFLLPAVPLLLSSVRLPKRQAQAWIGVWLLFNTVLGFLMGIYHQGGVVPAQLHIGAEDKGKFFGNIGTVIWWKTYPPPTWLLGSRDQGLERIKVVDMMGSKKDSVVEAIIANTVCDSTSDTRELRNQQTLIVAPRSARVPALAELDGTLVGGSVGKKMEIREIWRYDGHLNLDDLDWAGDGVWGTLSRVVGERGIGIYQVSGVCE